MYEYCSREFAHYLSKTGFSTVETIERGIER